MKQILLLLACSITTLAAFSQQDSLLKNFKYRIAHYRAISFNASGGSQYNKSEFASGTHKNNSSSGGGGATYYALKSTDRILLTTSASLYGSFNTTQSNNVGDINKSRTFSASPRLYALNKWFSKNNFFELGTDISANYYASKSVGSSYPGKNKSGEYLVQVNTGIGKGRLENVTDMQNAIWLSKALEASDRLSQPLSSEELNELGQTITKANNTRVLDSRKRTQFILSTIDGYLQQKNLINKTDINYFSNLNDILFFAFNTPRLSGIEKFIRFTPVIDGSGRDQHPSGAFNRYEENFFTESLVLSSGINKYTPASLIHQNNYGASLKLSYISRDITQRFYNTTGGIDELKNNAIGKQASINLFYNHAIYPSTRTIVNFYFQSEFGYQDEKNMNFYYGRANLYGALNYFISYRTRLTCNLGADYQKNAYRTYQGSTGVPENIQLYADAGIQINL
ncbi:MAG: hypothetical protein JWP81_2140 [Ferruginibacter sp.]|nr:hypothetical protein [Ferruginibacter sp.]